jgi:hypothetical protein
VGRSLYTPFLAALAVTFVALTGCNKKPAGVIDAQPLVDHRAAMAGTYSSTVSISWSFFSTQRDSTFLDTITVYYNEGEPELYFRYFYTATGADIQPVLHKAVFSPEGDASRAGYWAFYLRGDSLYYGDYFAKGGSSSSYKLIVSGRRMK